MPSACRTLPLQRQICTKGVSSQHRSGSVICPFSRLLCSLDSNNGQASTSQCVCCCLLLQPLQAHSTVGVSAASRHQHSSFDTLGAGCHTGGVPTIEIGLLLLQPANQRSAVMATLYKQTFAALTTLTAELNVLQQKPAGSTAVEWKVRRFTIPKKLPWTMSPTKEIRYLCPEHHAVRHGMVLGLHSIWSMPKP